MKMRALGVALLALAVAGYASYEALEAPANQLFGKTLVRGAPTIREVALTFDDGPNPPYTERILDVLAAEHVRATFFLVGRAVVAYPSTVRRIVRDGNVVGNHTWDHGHLIVETPSAVRSELLRTSDAIERIAHVRTTLMRPPFGARDFAVIAAAHSLGYRVVMWSVPLPKDWDQPGDATIVRRVVDNVADGSIIVLHDGDRGILCGRARVPASACDRRQDVAATREIIDTLRRRGYRFVTIPQLVADADRPLSSIPPPVEIDVAIGMDAGRIVVRPMHERSAQGVRNEFAYDRDAIARRDGHAWRELHVVDDFERPAVVAAHVEGLVHGVRVRA